MKARLVDRRRSPGPVPPPRWRESLPGLAARGGLDNWPLDVVLVDDSEIAAINRQWRGRDEATDVLSFSYLETEGSGPPSLVAGERYAARPLWRGPGDDAAGAPAGEVVLAPAWIDARCAQSGWDREAEWALLVAHGLLHVLGWEHDDDTGAAAMRSREAELLREHGLPHPLLGSGDAPAEGE